jgi:two-component system, cell cycle sensor histidine kinase and response regulator CckA
MIPGAVVIMDAVRADDNSPSMSGEADLVARLAGLAGGERASRLAAIVGSSDDAIIGKTLDGVLRRGLRVDHYVTRRVRKDGTVLDVSVSVSPILDEAGTIVGAASVARDISAQVRVEADRRAIEARQRQAEQLATVRRLASGVANDFSDALGVILGQIDLMSDQVPDGAELQVHVQALEGTAQRAARLTRQLLIFSQDDAVRPDDLDLNELISGLREMLTVSLGGKIDLQFRLNPELPQAWADRRHIEQVLMSLAENARDAMPAGGALTIGTDVTDLDQAYCARHPGTVPGHFVEMFVGDTGTGMTTAGMPAPAGRGAGLGLLSALNIVTGADGTFSVDTQEGSGSVYRVFLRPTGASGPREEAIAGPAASGEPGPAA